MIDAPDDHTDVRPIRPERPADTLIEREAAHVTRPVTVVAVVPVDEIVGVLHHIVYQAVAAAIVTVILGAAIGLVTLRRENDR